MTAKCRGKEFNSCWIGDRLLPLANVCINSFGAHDFKFNLYTYGFVRDVPAFAERRDAETILRSHELFIAHGGVETAADLFAYRFLASVGGWVVDNDVICNAYEIPDVEIAYAEERIGMVNNAVLKFPKAHPAIIDLLDHVATIDAVTAAWGATGPLALTTVFGRHRELARYNLPMSDVYPLHWKEAPKLLFPEFTSEILNKTAASPFIHLWGATLREIKFDFKRDLPPRGSYLDLVYTKYLDLHLLADLRPIDERDFRRSVQQYVERNWGVSLPLDGDTTSRQ